MTGAEAAGFLARLLRAGLFGAVLVALIVATRLLWPDGARLNRMDGLFLAALALQIWLIATGRETLEEARLILVFHIAGTLMEIYKTAHGSWIYPGAGMFRIGGAPLFAGFMYAAVGSWLMRAWRLLDLRLAGAPPLWALYLLGAAAYANFFTLHYAPDLRWFLFLAAVLLLGRTRLSADAGHGRRSVPFLAPFIAAAFAVWLAENIATWGGVWLYPSQMHGWRMAPVGKFGSWFLLLLLSFALTAGLRREDAAALGAEPSGR